MFKEEKEGKDTKRKTTLPKFNLFKLNGAQKNVKLLTNG